jgi:hypothetical protein
MTKVMAMERSLFLFVVVVALVVAGATPAMADIQSVGGPGSSPGDFSQEFCEGGGATCGTFSGYFNNMEVFIETPGVTFSDAGTINSDSFGSGDAGTNWSASLINSQYIQYKTTTADQLGPLPFTWDFASDPSIPFTVDFYATENGAVVDSSGMSYPGWGGVALVQHGLANENTSPVPEPTSILSMGTLLLGLAGALKRKWA